MKHTSRHLHRFTALWTRPLAGLLVFALGVDPALAAVAQAAPQTLAARYSLNTANLFNQEAVTPFLRWILHPEETFPRLFNNTRPPARRFFVPAEGPDFGLSFFAAEDGGGDKRRRRREDVGGSSGQQLTQQDLQAIIEQLRDILPLEFRNVQTVDFTARPKGWPSISRGWLYQLSSESRVLMLMPELVSALLPADHNINLPQRHALVNLYAAAYFRQLSMGQQQDLRDNPGTSELVNNIAELAANDQGEAVGLAMKWSGVPARQIEQAQGYFGNLLQMHDLAIARSRALRVSAEILESAYGRHGLDGLTQLMQQTAAVTNVVTGLHPASRIDRSLLSREQAEGIQQLFWGLRQVDGTILRLIELPDGDWYIYDEYWLMHEAQKHVEHDSRLNEAVTAEGLEHLIRVNKTAREGLFFELSNQPMAMSSDSTASNWIKNSAMSILTSQRDERFTRWDEAQKCYRAATLGRHVFDLGKATIETAFIATMERPEVLPQGLMAELENHRIFNHPIRHYVVIDDSSPKALAINRETLARLAKEYGVEFTHLTSRDRSADQSHYAYRIAQRYQKELEAGTLDERILKLLKEHGILKHGVINAAKLNEYFMKNVFTHISGVRNYTLLRALGETIMHFDDDAPPESYILSPSDLANLRATRLRARAVEMEALKSDVAQVVGHPVQTDLELYEIFAHARPEIQARLDKIQEKYFGFNPTDSHIGRIPRAMGQIISEESTREPGLQVDSNRYRPIMDVDPHTLVQSDLHLPRPRYTKADADKFWVWPVDVVGANERLIGRKIEDTRLPIRDRDLRGATASPVTPEFAKDMWRRIIMYIPCIFVGDQDTSGLIQFWRYLRLNGTKIAPNLQHADQTTLVGEGIGGFGGLTYIIFNRAFLLLEKLAFTIGRALRLEEPPFIKWVAAPGFNHEVGMAYSPVAGGQQRSISERIYRISYQDWTEIVGSIARPWYEQSVQRFEEQRVQGLFNSDAERYRALGQSYINVSTEVNLSNDQKDYAHREQRMRVRMASELGRQLEGKKGQELLDMTTILIQYAHDFHLYHAKVISPRYKTDEKFDYSPADPKKDYFYRTRVSADGKQLHWEKVYPVSHLSVNGAVSEIRWENIGSEGVASIPIEKSGDSYDITVEDGRHLLFDQLPTPGNGVAIVPAVVDAFGQEYLDKIEKTARGQIQSDGETIMVTPDFEAAGRDFKMAIERIHRPGWERDPEYLETFNEVLERRWEAVEMRGSSAIPVLRWALEDADPNVVRAAAQVLVKLKEDPFAIDALRDVVALPGSSDESKRIAAEMLAPILAERSFTVLLAGGASSRFWPADKIFADLTGSGRSLLQQAQDRAIQTLRESPFSDFIDPSHFYVSTSEDFKPKIESQLNVPHENVLPEPSRRGTLAGLLWPMAHIRQKIGSDGIEDPILSNLTSDHVIGNEPLFRETLAQGMLVADAGPHIVTIGIQPSKDPRAWTGFGALHGGTEMNVFGRLGKQRVYQLSRFEEKPSNERAQEMMKEQPGWTWNSGMFIGKLSTFERALEDYNPEIFKIYQDMVAALQSGDRVRADALFNSIPTKIPSPYPDAKPGAMVDTTFDYAIMMPLTFRPKSGGAHAFVIPGHFPWMDVGSWDAVDDVIAADPHGNRIIGGDRVKAQGLANTTLVAFGQQTIDAAGLPEGLVVIHNENGNVLVMPKAWAQDVRKVFEAVKAAPADPDIRIESPNVEIHSDGPYVAALGLGKIRLDIRLKGKHLIIRPLDTALVTYDPSEGRGPPRPPAMASEFWPAKLLRWAYTDAAALRSAITSYKSGDVRSGLMGEMDRAIEAAKRLGFQNVLDLVMDPTKTEQFVLRIAAAAAWVETNFIWNNIEQELKTLYLAKEEQGTLHSLTLTDHRSLLQQAVVAAVERLMEMHITLPQGDLANWVPAAQAQLDLIRAELHRELSLLTNKHGDAMNWESHFEQVRFLHENYDISSLKQPQRRQEMHARIMSGEVLSEDDNARFGVDQETFLRDLEYLASMDREIDGGNLAGVDKVPAGEGFTYRRVVVDNKLRGAYDMRGPVNPLWTDKTNFYCGLAIGQWARENHVDMALNSTASHNPIGDDGWKWSVRAQRGPEPIILVGESVRPTSASMKKFMMLGLRAAGIAAYDIGITSTPETYAALAYFQGPGEVRDGTLVSSPLGDDHWVRALDGKQSRAIYDMLPSSEKSEQLRTLQANFRSRGCQLADARRPLVDSRIDADNEFVRHHNAWIAAFVRLGPRITTWLFEARVQEGRVHVKPDDFKAIVDALESIQWPASQEELTKQWGKIRNQLGLPWHDFLEPPPYAIASPLKGMTFGTDYANGSSWREAQLLESLGATVVAAEVDGKSTGRPTGGFLHNPNPTQTENQAWAIALAKKLGIPVVMKDEDGDRGPFIDEKGRAITGGELSAILSRFISGPILTDVRVPHYAIDAMVNAGGRILNKTLFVGPVGYAFYGMACFIIKAMFKNRQPSALIYPDHDAHLTANPEDLVREPVGHGIEPSMHAFFRSNGYANDASYLTGVMLWVMLENKRRFGEHRTLADLNDEIPKNPCSPPEVRIQMTENVPVNPYRNQWRSQVAAELQEKLPLMAPDSRFVFNTIDGLEIQQFDKDGKFLGKALFRTSNNEPLGSTFFEGSTFAAKHRLEEMIITVMTESHFTYPTSNDREVTAVFHFGGHTSQYITHQDIEVTADGRQIFHPSVLDRIKNNQQLWERLGQTPGAQGRILAGIESEPHVKAATAYAANPQPLVLEGQVQHYDWGGRSLIHIIQDLLGIAWQEVKKPFAELWLGAHPSASSIVQIDDTEMTLFDLLKLGAAQAILGTEISRQYYARLPFLFKVLTAEKMLSIQAHPTKQQAEEGYRREDEMELPHSADNRNYKDQNHKPEIGVALTDFWLLHGFRSLDEIAFLLIIVPELHAIMPDFKTQYEKVRGDKQKEEDLLRALYQRVMLDMSDEEVDAILDPMAKRLMNDFTNPLPPDKKNPEFWANRAFTNFPKKNGHWDRGIISIFLLNLVHLSPGQATYQPAGVLHAYLEGANMELMANSDNVLRGGLTPKHVDVPELMKTLSFLTGKPVILEGESISPTERVYKTPAKEFEISQITVSQGVDHRSVEGHGVEIITVYSTTEAGPILLETKDKKIMLKQGQTVLIPAGLYYVIEGRAVLYKATVPASPHSAVDPGARIINITDQGA